MLYFLCVYSDRLAVAKHYEELEYDSYLFTRELGNLNEISLFTRLQSGRRSWIVFNIESGVNIL